MNHEEFEIEEVTAYAGFKPGRREWTENDIEEIEKTYRLWPHYIWRGTLCRSFT